MALGLGIKDLVDVDHHGVLLALYLDVVASFLTETFQSTLEGLAAVELGDGLYDKVHGIHGLAIQCALDQIGDEDQ